MNESSSVRERKFLLVESCLKAAFLEWLIQPDTESTILDIIQNVREHSSSPAVTLDAPTPPPAIAHNLPEAIPGSESPQGRGIDGRGIDGRGIDGRGVDGRGVDGRSVDGRSVEVEGNGREGKSCGQDDVPASWRTDDSRMAFYHRDTDRSAGDLSADQDLAMTPVGSGLSPENAAANHATYDQSSPALREAPGTGDEEQLREKLHRDERFREEQERMQGLSQSAAEAESVGLLPGAASSFASASLGSSSFGSATEGSSVQGSLATTSSVQGSLAPGSSVQGSGSLVQGSVVRGGTSTLYNSLTDSQWPVAESVGESLGAVENLGTVSVTEPVAEFHDVAESPAQLRFASDVQDEGMGQAESSEPAGAKVGEFYTVPSFRQHMKEGLTTRSREMLDRIFGASLEDATLDFVTFEQTVVSQVWGLSNYMSCCLYSMIKGISLTEISETVHAITAAVDVHVASGYLVRRSELEKFWVENQLSLSEGYVWNLFAVIRAASRKSRPDGSGQAVTDVTDEGGSQGQVSQTEDGAGGSGAGGSVEKSNSVSKSASLLSYFEDEEVVNIKDFYPFLCELVLRHKPVEFLRTYTEFQKRLCDTTSYKLAFDLWGSVDGDITYTRFGASCLADTWYYISSSQHEMSQVRDFFSYEQFYVVYCLFYALDADKDGTIDRQDLIKYNSYAYSDLVINRITQESGPEYFDSHGRMNFNGFLKFVLIDEDKTTDQAIEYWFRIVDLDGDGYIRQYEIDNFYQDQQARLTSRSLDAPSVDVIHSQM